MRPINLTEGMKTYKELSYISERISKTEDNLKFLGETPSKNMQDHLDILKGTQDKLNYELNVFCIKHIDPAIKDAQGRARVRTLDGICIFRTLVEVENRLGISKSAMNGIVVSIDPWAMSFPNSYNGIPMSTQFTATYKDRHWVLTRICRTECKPASRHIFIVHTEDSKAALVKRFTYME